MRGDTRHQLLRAAERVLIEEGVRALTMRRVGEVSGLNPTLITYHFGSVAALLTCLRDHNLTPMLESWKVLEDPLPEGADPVRTLLQRWLQPLLAPACCNPDGRALIVIDEIVAHGDADTSEEVMRRMDEVAGRLERALAPHLPQLPPEELRARLRFIAGAALGPPPRARLAAQEADPAMGADYQAALLRFACAALKGGMEELAQAEPAAEKARA